MIYLFEDCSLDTDRREFRRGTRLVSVAPKAFDLLEHLIRERECVVSKDDLIAAVWGGRIVSESALTTRLNEARSAIGDSGDDQRLIKTLPRKGVRFVGAVREQQGTAASRAVQSTGTSQSSYQPPPLASERMAAEASQAAPTVSQKPSIAVLPFANLSGDPEQEYFADGTAEEIITGLSRIKWLWVTSRSSSFIYKNKAMGVMEVADKLGVRYVLEGSVRKSGNRVRITAQLIDAETDAHLWAEKYDRSLEDIFAVQDDITMRVIGAIEPSLRKAEIDRIKRQRPTNLNAYDLVLRSLPFLYALMPKQATKAVPLLEEALKLEPDYGFAHAFLSWCLHVRFSRGGLRQEDRIAAIQHARAAIAHNNDDATAIAVAAFVIALDEHDTAAALKLFDRALALSNSNVFALSSSAITLALLGNAKLAIERAKRALQLSPFDTLNFRSYSALAIASFHTEQYDDAADAARSAIEANPGFSFPRAILAAALMRLGRVEEAKVAAQAVLECEPSFTIRGSSATNGLEPTVIRPLGDAWREAGLPD